MRRSSSQTNTSDAVQPFHLNQLTSSIPSNQVTSLFVNTALLGRTRTLRVPGNEKKRRSETEDACRKGRTSLVPRRLNSKTSVLLANSATMREDRDQGLLPQTECFAIPRLGGYILRKPAALPLGKTISPIRMQPVGEQASQATPLIIGDTNSGGS
jgi:hypothetical protein